MHAIDFIGGVGGVDSIFDTDEQYVIDYAIDFIGGTRDPRPGRKWRRRLVKHLHRDHARPQEVLPESTRITFYP